VGIAHELDRCSRAGIAAETLALVALPVRGSASGMFLHVFQKLLQIRSAVLFHAGCVPSASGGGDAAHESLVLGAANDHPANALAARLFAGRFFEIFARHRGRTAVVRFQKMPPGTYLDKCHNVASMLRRRIVRMKKLGWIFGTAALAVVF